MKRIRIDEVRLANTRRNRVTILPLDAVNAESLADMGVQSMRGIDDLIDLERGASKLSRYTRETLYLAVTGNGKSKHSLFYARKRLRKAA